MRGAQGDTRRSNPCTFFIMLSLRHWELTDIASLGHTLNSLPLHRCVSWCIVSYAKYHYSSLTVFSFHITERHSELSMNNEPAFFIIKVQSNKYHHTMFLVSWAADETNFMKAHNLTRVQYLNIFRA